MTRFTGIGLAIAAACLLAACATAALGPQAARTPSARDQAAQVWHRLVQCARQNGMPDLPDPTIDDQGQAHFPDGLPSPPPSVARNCQAIYDQLPAQARKDALPAGEVANLRRFAQCMRDHGITDWPDPDDEGAFHLPPTLDGNIKTGPRWPQIQAAWSGPCKRYDPSGQLRFAGK